jgi:recombination protein RecA
MSRLKKAISSLKSNDEVDLDDTKVDLSGQEEPVPCISTGSIVLNYMVGGNKLDNGERQCPGIPRGKITEVFGPQGSGKTTLGIEAAVKCQENGGSVCYIDYENALVPEYAKNLGLSFEEDKFQLFQPPHWEAGAEIILAMIKEQVDLIIVDSVAAMKPKKAVEENDASSTGQIGHLARLMSAYLPKITHPMKKSETALMFINQLRSRVKTSRYDTGPDEETSGGRALKYYCSLRVKLKKRKTEYAKVENELTGDKDKQPVSNVVQAKNVKCKVSPHQGHRAEFVIRYGEGIDNIRSVIDIATARDIITQAGPWYKFPGANGEEQKCQGKENLRNHFISNPDDFNTIVNEVSGFSSGYGGTVDTEDKEIEVEEEDE